MTLPQPLRRPGGRSARARDAVHEAVLALPHERSWEELSIPAVADRSGVHQATIYRRWRSASALPDTGSLRGDLEAYAEGVARGETPPTLDDLIEIVLAPLYFSALFASPDEPGRPGRLVDRLLAGPPAAVAPEESS